MGKITLLFMKPPRLHLPAVLSAQLMQAGRSGALGAVIVLASFLTLALPAYTLAQENNHTAREEKEGRAVWEKLQNKQISCDQTSDDDFGALGEYFMGQMVGDSHEAMNTMMERMMGKEGEKQTHTIMGKRLSGCEPNAQIPSKGIGFMPMMGMMQMLGGGENPMMGGWSMMSRGWGDFGILNWLSMLLFWVVLILGIIALIRYLARSGQGKEDKTPLDILKERYARGEINKKEFGERKKDLA